MKNRSHLSRIIAISSCTAVTLLIVFGCGKAKVPGADGVPTTPGAGGGIGGLGKGPAAVALGGAGGYILLAQTAITDVPSSAITGNVGLSPGTGAGIGLACPEVTGTINTVDAAGPACKVTAAGQLTTAISDKNTAYTDAAGRAPDYTELGAGNVGGLTLSAGTYKWGTGVLIPTDLTLTGGANDVWIFQIAQTLTVSSGVKVILAGGALAQNIYWQVASSVDLGTTSVFKGTLISQTQIALKTGATVNGKLMAGSQITLDHATVAP